jgi:hypothetical protein
MSNHASGASTISALDSSAQCHEPPSPWRWRDSESLAHRNYPYAIRGNH